MEILGIIFLGLLVLVYFWYVTLIKRRNKALEALSGIDAHYNMRFDLIPNILKVAQKFMDHEKGLLTEITELRTEVQKGYDKSKASEVTDHLSKIEMPRRKNERHDDRGRKLSRLKIRRHHGPNHANL